MDVDLIILGAGPAGLTAGMYAARARIPLLIIEKALPGGQMTSTELIENYPGFTEPVYGIDLSQKMEAHAKQFGAQIAQDSITQVHQTDTGFTLDSESGQAYTCSALIIASGASPVKLGIPGELDLAGKGVSYCSVCDGPFFRDVEVAVVGGGDSALEEATYLTRFASAVHLIHRRDEFRAIKEIQEKAFSEPKIKVHRSTVPVAVQGEREVTGIQVRSLKNNEESVIPVTGVFFYVGLRPNTTDLFPMLEKDERGFLITDDRMACGIPGVFAAGDVRSKQLRQIVTAVGDGAQAAFSAQHYIENLPATARQR